MSASTVPLKPFISHLTAAEDVQSIDSNIAIMDVDKIPPRLAGSSDAGKGQNEVEMAEDPVSGSEDVEMLTVEETVEEVSPRGMVIATSGAGARTDTKKSDDKLAGAPVKSEPVTGLSFFVPPEELDDVKSSPDTIRHAQNIVAGSMMDFESTADLSAETVSDPESTMVPGTTSTMVHAVCAPALVSPLSLSPATNFSLSVDAKVDLENDSYENIMLESPDLASVDPVSSLREEKKDTAEEEGMAVAQAIGVIADEAVTETEAKATSTVTAVTVVVEEPECPFQKQLALQEQEDTETKQSKIAAGFKPRRKRNNSSGGKKLLLKKKTSLPNLRNSFQQQQPLHQAAAFQSESDVSNLASPTSASGKVASSDYVIPPFYFPMGKPVAASKRRQRVHSAVVRSLWYVQFVYTSVVSLKLTYLCLPTLLLH
jgi:hypothetical protein